MGTHACTRIATKDDYLELHTRWDGFPDEIKSDLKSLNQRWTVSLEKFIKGLDADVSSPKYLRDWASGFYGLVQDNISHQSLENTAMLLAGQDFVHHHVLPHAMTEDLADYWGRGNPDVTAVLKDADKMSFSKKSKINLKEKEISAEWKVMRVYGVDDNSNINKEEFIDIKFKCSIEDLFFSLLQLPQFWRDLYNVTKEKDDDWKSVNAGGPLWKLGNALRKFYQPTQEYMLYSRGKVDGVDKSRDDEGYKKALEDSLLEVSASIPFDFYINAFLTHLWLRCPNVVAPVTNAEHLSSYTPVVEVMVDTERMSALLFKSNEHDKKWHQDLLVKSVEEIKQRESDFFESVGLPKEQLNLGSYFIKNNNDEAWLGFTYENNLAIIMQSQYDVELKAKGVGSKKTMIKK